MKSKIEMELVAFAGDFKLVARRGRLQTFYFTAIGRNLCLKSNVFRKILFETNSLGKTDFPKELKRILMCYGQAENKCEKRFICHNLRSLKLFFSYDDIQCVLRLRKAGRVIRDPRGEEGLHFF